jgi:hypothetical protein
MMAKRLNVSAAFNSLLVLAVALTISPVASAQTGQRVQPANGERRAASSATVNDSFAPHDLSGIWRFNGTGFSASNAPPLTAAGNAKYDVNIPGLGGAPGRNKPLGNDPMMICDPLGFPRVLSFGAYPMEIVQLPDRIIQFFDFFYTHRTIWTDGRKLPDDPEPTWYGYSVGHWEGNTLVVESTGFNGRAWVANGGYPYSEDAKLEERYTRVGHDTINISMTLTDATTYAQPWVSGAASLRWSPNEVMREDVCSPSDEKKYLDEIREPAAGKPAK